MSPDILNFVSASDVRSKYAFLFECVAQLYNLAFNEKASKKFDEVLIITEELKDSDIISEYLYENLKQLYNLYPTMLPGKVAEGYKGNQEKEEERLTKLSKYLRIIIGDLCGEIKELCDKASSKSNEIAISEAKSRIKDEEE